jgi:hypothetical protein
MTSNESTKITFGILTGTVTIDNRVVNTQCNFVIYYGITRMKSSPY